MRKKSSLMCMKLFSALVSAIISVGFLASMCCCNCGSAYADDVVAGSELANAEACAAAQLADNAAKPSSSATVGAKLCRVKKGHTDVFATYKDASGNLVLGTRGDSFPGSNANKIRYDSSLIRFVVGKKSRVRKTKVFSFVKQNVKHVYQLPSQNEPGQLFAGVSTETLGDDSGIKQVTFSFTNATMPKNGEVYMAGKDGGKRLKYLGTDGTGFPSEYTVDGHAHVHMDWVFTAPGKYVLTVKAVAETNEGEKLTATQDYTFEVDLNRAKESSQYDTVEGDSESEDSGNQNGTSPKVKKKKGSKGSEGKDSNDDSDEDADEDSEDDDEDDEEDEDSEDEDDDSDEDSENEDGDGNTPKSIVVKGNNNKVYVAAWPGAMPNGGFANQNSENEEETETEAGKNNLDSKQSKSKNKNKKTTKKCSKFKDIKGDKLVIKNGHVDLATYGSSNGIGFAVQEDVTGSHVKRDTSKVVFYAGNDAKNGNIWRLPQTQKQNVPWLGWNNQNLQPHKSSKISLKSVKGPGSVRIWLQGALGKKAKTVMSSNGKRTYTIPSNTHMHLNWDFSKPGYYTIRFAVSAHGKTLEKDVHFAIGVDALETPMSCSVSEVTSESDPENDDADGDNGRDDSNNSENEEDNAKNENQNENKNENGSGANGNSGNSGVTPLSSPSYVSGSRSSYFGGGLSGRYKAGNRSKIVKLTDGMNKTSGKEIQSKYKQKSVRGLGGKLRSRVKAKGREPQGIVGLFKRKPAVAYTALSLGVTAISGTCAAGVFILRKRGLISGSGLLSAIMSIK